ncbi:type IV secretion system DNA-binding domain-containing protein, partial [Cysteiniphilum litorale]|uniref:type IV secretion system DNA-binding domain-containing protein n=1 Tax=Cysteiniphilum litorale TaxID=2056700 RepID=UPI003F883151
STQVFLRSTSADIADEISKELGECEVIERLESNSYGAESVRDGISINPSRRTKRVVSYTEIQSMNDLEVYIKLPANVPRVKMKLAKPRQQNSRQQGFIERQIVVNSQLENALKNNIEDNHGGANFQAITTVAVMTNTPNTTNNTTPSTHQTSTATATESKIDDRNNIMTDAVLTKNDDDNNKHHAVVKANLYKVSEKEI